MQNRWESPLAFFTLVFVLSIPFWVLGTIHPIDLLPGLPVSALGAFTPALAALLLVYTKAGISGVLQLLQRSWDFKNIKNGTWYLVFLFVNPVIAVLAYATMRALGTSLPNPAPLTFTLVPMFLVFLVAALGEEIGWTGYITEPMQDHLGVFNAGLALGLVWAIWHFIPLMQVQRSMAWIAWWSLDTISLRLIMIWLYVHAGKSILAAAVFHALINLCWQLFPINGSYYDPRVFGLITLCVAIAFFALQRYPLKGKAIAS